MPTYKICVFEHQKRRDGKYPVSIRIFWGRIAYMQTEYYVTPAQVKKVSTLRNGKKKSHLELKDTFIINELNRRIVKYERMEVERLRDNIKSYTAKELVEYFQRNGAPGSDGSIDFIEFSGKHIQKLVSQGRKSTADTFRRTVNAIIDFTGRQSVSINEINSKFLTSFEDYLKSNRTITRKNQFGKCVTYNMKPLSEVSVTDYMTDIRTLFNAARDEYNDEDRDEIKIRHYPFRKYKIKSAPEPKKRNLSPDQIRKIIYSEPKLERTIFARDCFLLSFYLAGINFADLYDAPAGAFKDGRLTYNRRKVKGRRKDKGLISIIVDKVALSYFERYRDKTGARVFDFYKRYRDSHVFTSNVNKGLKDLGKLCEIPEKLSTYYARHSFADIARNYCDISKDDVHLALNHVDQGLKITDVYISKDWSKVDNVIRKVIQYIKKKTR